MAIFHCYVSSPEGKHQKNHEKTPVVPPDEWCTSGPKGAVLGRTEAPDDLSVAGRDAVHTPREVCKEKRVVHHGGQKIVDPVPESGNWWENFVEYGNGNSWKIEWKSTFNQILCLLISMWIWPCFTCTCAYTLIISYAYTCAYMCIAKHYNTIDNTMQCITDIRTDIHIRMTYIVGNVDVQYIRAIQKGRHTLIYIDIHCTYTHND